MAFLNAERAVLRGQITRAEHEAARWEHALGALSRQSAQHRVEAEQQAHVVTAADARLADVRAAVAALRGTGGGRADRRGRAAGASGRAWPLTFSAPVYPSAPDRDYGMGR
ncbi:MAG: family ATPase [Actinotalea sp.]|nr:family ATPase [Actinotalea sp.]